MGRPLFIYRNHIIPGIVLHIVTIAKTFPNVRCGASEARGPVRRSTRTHPSLPGAFPFANTTVLNGTSPNNTNGRACNLPRVSQYMREQLAAMTQGIDVFWARSSPWRPNFSGTISAQTWGSFAPARGPGPGAITTAVWWPPDKFHHVWWAALGQCMPCGRRP